MSEDKFSKFQIETLYVSQANPIYQVFQEIQNHVFAIVDGDQSSNIVGSAFFCMYKKKLYFVTNAHLIVDLDRNTGVWEENNLNLVFEGNRLNEYYVLYRDCIRKLKARWLFGKHKRMDLAILGVEIADTIWETLGIKPIFLDGVINGNYMLTNGLDVFGVCYPKGKSVMTDDLEINNELGQEIWLDQNFKTFLPLKLTGQILSFEEFPEQDRILIHQFPGSHGVSGSPMFVRANNGPKIIGVNYRANIVKVKNTYRFQYANQVKTLPLESLVLMLEKYERSELPYIQIEMEHFNKIQRKFSYLTLS